MYTLIALAILIALPYSDLTGDWKGCTFASATVTLLALAQLGWLDSSSVAVIVVIVPVLAIVLKKFFAPSTVPLLPNTVLGIRKSQNGLVIALAWA